MITVERYRTETDETSRTRIREELAASIRRQREHLARLYATDAITVLRRQFPQAHRLTFTVGEDEMDPTGPRTTVEVVGIFDTTGTVLFPNLVEDTDDELDDDSVVCDLLAAAVEQGGPDFFDSLVEPVCDLLRAATHGLSVTDLDRAYDEDRQAVLAALNLRTYPAEPQYGDRSPHVVLEVLGVTIGVRHRANETFVHLDTDELPEQLGPLVVEVDNGGENVYGA